MEGEVVSNLPAAGVPLDVSEIEHLLEQCTTEDLSSILDNLSGGIPLPPADPSQAQNAVGTTLSNGAAEPAPPAAAESSPPLVPAPPIGPPPQSTAGKTNPRQGKLVQAQPQSDAAAHPLTVATIADAGEEPMMSMTDIRSLLAHHGEAVLGEVRRLVSASTAPAIGGTSAHPSGQEATDVAFLAEVLRQRDEEVCQLEAQLQALEAQLAEKDEHVLNLRGQLDHTIREVRHRQLDLEFIQTKLEDRMRLNVEAEAAQRVMASRIEELSLMAKHCAVDNDTCIGSSTLPLHAQGALSWTARKQRHLPCLNMAGLQVGAAPLTQPPASSLQ